MRFAVSFINWYDHKLTTVIVEAPNWQAALLKHPEVSDIEVGRLTSLEEAKQYFFDMDAMFEVVEIPNA